MSSFQIDCQITETPIADGKIHRFKIGIKPNKNGWYLLFPEEKFGIAGNWATGEKTNWREEGYETTREDKERIKQAIIEQEKQQLKNWESVAEQCLEYVSECSPKGHSEYLVKKKIKANGASFFSNKLVLPLQDASGKIWSYQEIYANGQKMFASGGKIKGCFFPIICGEIKKNDLIVVCEGFATGASIHQETGLPVFCAMMAGNLKAVCDSLPYTNIIIAADNDASGIGEQKAKEAGFKYVMPLEAGKDFSDLFIAGEYIKSFFIQEIKTENKIHGLVGEIADWITSTALRPQPKLSLASALTIVATLKGRKFKTKTNLYSNIYCLTIAESGTGKDHPQKMLKMLCQNLFMSPPASNTGFIDELSSLDGHGVLMLDELADWIDTSRSKGMAHKASIFRSWLELFGCSRDSYIGERRADASKEKVKKIDKPLFCLLTASTPEKLQRSMASDDISGGLLNRFLFFVSDDRPRKTKHHELNKEFLPDHVKEKLLDYITPSKEECKPLLFNLDAYNLYYKIDDYFEDQLQKIDDNNLRLLYNRASEYVGKIALVLCDDVEITVKDVECSFEIVKSSIADSLKFCSGIARNNQEADFIRIRNLIKDNKVLSRNDLTRKIQGGIDNKRKFEIILDLEAIGDIVIIKDGKKEIYKFTGKN